MSAWTRTGPLAPKAADDADELAIEQALTDAHYDLGPYDDPWEAS